MEWIYFITGVAVGIGIMCQVVEHIAHREFMEECKRRRKRW